MSEQNNIIVGAGPAGVGCAYTFSQNNYPFIVIEKETKPGGFCRTLSFHGYLFDIGGHRFLSKSDEVNDLWKNILKDDMISVKRQSRIYYRKKYFDYPLSFFNTFWNLGLWETSMCVGSYLLSRFSNSPTPVNFESWTSKHFGKRLYKIFFKSYTEKVWGMPCENISSDWAMQRIHGLSLKVAIKKALLKNSSNQPKTLSTEFLYPRTGPGYFYKKLSEHAESNHGKFIFNSKINKIKHDQKRITSVVFRKADKKNSELLVKNLISSMALTDFIEALDPRPPDEIILASQKLVFRNLIVVNIIMAKEHIFSDQWLYLHSPELKIGRIQNYKNWSPAMVLDKKNTSLGLEYFCNKQDTLWKMDDVSLIDYALGELEKTGIVQRKYLIDGFVFRGENAYPTYSVDYKKYLELIKKYLKQFTNLQMIGRSGLFRYDNSDHALLTGMYAAKNILKQGSYDTWQVDADKSYLE